MSLLLKIFMVCQHNLVNSLQINGGHVNGYVR